MRIEFGITRLGISESYILGDFATDSLEEKLNPEIGSRSILSGLLLRDNQLKVTHILGWKKASMINNRSEIIDVT